MTRPQKATAEYFPHSATHGKTLFTLESKYGNDGYAAWFKILELLTAAENHFIDCRNPEDWEFLLAKTRLNRNTVKEMLNLLAKLDAINAKLWNMGIIRSDNLINNLSPLYRRRASSVVSNERLIELLSTKTPDNGQTGDEKPQSKVKNSIVVIPTPTTTTKNDSSISEKITAAENQISEFLAVFGATKATETEKILISRAVEAGCTPEHLSTLVCKNPHITSIRSEWVLRELIAVKRNSGDTTEQQMKEVERLYGSCY